MYFYKATYTVHFVHLQKHHGSDISSSWNNFLNFSVDIFFNVHCLQYALCTIRIYLCHRLFVTTSVQKHYYFIAFLPSIFPTHALEAGARRALTYVRKALRIIWRHSLIDRCARSCRVGIRKKLERCFFHRLRAAVSW